MSSPPPYEDEKEYFCRSIEPAPNASGSKTLASHTIHDGLKFPGLHRAIIMASPVSIGRRQAPLGSPSAAARVGHGDEENDPLLPLPVSSASPRRGRLPLGSDPEAGNNNAIDAAADDDYPYPLGPRPERALTLRLSLVLLLRLLIVGFAIPALAHHCRGYMWSNRCLLHDDVVRMFRALLVWHLTLAVAEVLHRVARLLGVLGGDGAKRGDGMALGLPGGVAVVVDVARRGGAPPSRTLRVGMGSLLLAMGWLAEVAMFVATTIVCASVGHNWNGKDVPFHWLFIGFSALIMLAMPFGVDLRGSVIVRRFPQWSFQRSVQLR